MGRLIQAGSDMHHYFLVLSSQPELWRFITEMSFKLFQNITFGEISICLFIVCLLRLKNTALSLLIV